MHACDMQQQTAETLKSFTELQNTPRRVIQRQQQQVECSRASEMLLLTQRRQHTQLASAESGILSAAHEHSWQTCKGNTLPLPATLSLWPSLHLLTCKYAITGRRFYTQVFTGLHIMDLQTLAAHEH